MPVDVQKKSGLKNQFQTAPFTSGEFLGKGQLMSASIGRLGCEAEIFGAAADFQTILRNKKGEPVLDCSPLFLSACRWYPVSGRPSALLSDKIRYGDFLILYDPSLLYSTSASR